jgi:hypothetical protein
MTYALIDLYGVATGRGNNLNGNGRMNRPRVDAGAGGNQGNFSKTQHPFEDNATVSEFVRRFLLSSFPNNFTKGIV